MLDQRIIQRIREIQGKLESDGELRPQAQLDVYYNLFRSRFGPDVLKHLDGEALLMTMFNLRDKGSMAYWLEFKNDDEFPAIFGSIAGGNALKWGIYLRRESVRWYKGTPRDQIQIEDEEAIEIARKYRGQLIGGAKALGRMRGKSSDSDYKDLQEEMNAVAPEVGNLGWGHKYFHLLFPDLLDDYHNPDYQRFHLIRLLQEPLKGDGRFLNGGRFVAIAKELDLPMNHLTRILSTQCSSPYSYWRIGTAAGDASEDRFGIMCEGSFVAVGWDEIQKDLSDISCDNESKEKLRKTIAEHFASRTPQSVGTDTKELFTFVAGMKEGDVVVAMKGATVQGIGRVTGPYFYDETSPYFRHRRPVSWDSLDSWEMEPFEGLRTTLYQLRKYPKNLISVESRMIEAPSSTLDHSISGVITGLPGICGKIQSILKRKSQVILYGPPGTGKSHWSEQAALRIAALHNCGKNLEDLSQTERHSITESDEPFVRLCTFHPAYGYEDFIEGYRPDAIGGAVGFKLKDGIFKKMCRDAKENPSKLYILIIDEINRGDIPRIMGELMTVLEKNKRGKSILLPVSGTSLIVPENVYVIGTMNTADRSIALLDTALRRRFGFLEIMPDLSIFGDISLKSIPIKAWLKTLNERIVEVVGHNARNLQIGHSYFMEQGKPIVEFAKFAKIIQEDVIPLLEEYCYENYESLEKILGKGLVDAGSMRIRHELFDDQRWNELAEALLAPVPDIVTSGSAVSASDEMEADVEPAASDDSE